MHACTANTVKIYTSAPYIHQCTFQSLLSVYKYVLERQIYTHIYSIGTVYPIGTVNYVGTMYSTSYRNSIYVLCTVYHIAIIII